ncbi:indolepyruvate oxidoreductase subunit beta [Heliophilum fasciatum]|uniref:Indolepyruvate ferredoxin oxidoreductase beta subunit n=1 Tax=Heliophilum fasciatum TaxID=35700 RepID=A0A4R2RIX6_9FIRM|nr:indolepyruvate oxidoreductase subunit beta [Heliophilum fasciatum]MCW2278368.1 indolepyruvate ferredoxin oxidoreductase beta subunit [Heliophilum fasciatum]TCP63760.1 indolepyruvate ferredoxin oxidoreductase beta subunit [Heliophilum fasciatum]
MNKNGNSLQTENVTPSNWAIIITGVGGQGGVLASRIMAEAAIIAGYEVRTSETIGMAQREGVVVSHIKIGRDLGGPLIGDGTAQILLSLELAESLRGWPKLHPAGQALINCRPIIPPGVASGMTQYNQAAIMDFLQQQGSRACLFDATAAAIEAGSSKATNMVMLGAFSTLPNLPFTAEQLWQGATTVLPPKLHAVNQSAFAAGQALMTTAPSCG